MKYEVSAHGCRRSGSILRLYNNARLLLYTAVCEFKQTCASRVYSSVVCEEPRQINSFSAIEHNTYNGTHNDHRHLPTFRATKILPPA